MENSKRGVVDLNDCLDQFTEIEVSKIIPNPKQTRKTFEREPLRELGQSIRKRGLLQPINVKPNPEEPGGFIIIHGERRWRACRLIGMERVPSIIRNNGYTEDDLAIDQLIENVCREDLKVIEKSHGIESLFCTISGIKKLDGEEKHRACLTLVGLVKACWGMGRDVPPPTKKNFYLVEDDIDKAHAYMRMTGLSFNVAIQHLKILELPPEIKKMIVFSRSAGRLGKGPRKTMPFSIAYELSRLDNVELIRAVAARAMRDCWTKMRVRATVDTIIEENVQDYGIRYRSKKPKYKDLGISKLTDECFDAASKITNWRRLALKRIKYTILEAGLDFRVALKLLRRATKELTRAIDNELDGERPAEEKRNAVLRDLEFIVPFGGKDNRIAIPSKIIRAYGVPSFRNKENRGIQKHGQNWRLRVQIKEAWET